MSEQILCEQCNNPVDPEEYGSYCELHRLNTDGCCRNHCLVESGEGETHCRHCDLSYPHMIEKVINEIIYTTSILKQKRVHKDFLVLLDFFNTDFPPELWVRRLLCSISNSVDLEWEESFSTVNNMDEFIITIAETLSENGTTKRDIEDIIITSYTGLLREHLLELLNRIFSAIEFNEYDSDSDEDDIDPDAFYESNLTRVKSKNEQLESLSKNNIKLCEKCLIPTDEDLCNDCRNTD